MSSGYSPKSILIRLQTLLKHPASVPAILRMLDVPKRDKPSVKKILKTLQKQGKLVKLRKGVLGFTDNMSTTEGVFQGHEKGFGFVVVKGEGDVFIPQRRVAGAMNGDLVQCRVDQVDKDGRKEGSILEIVKRGQNKLFGYFQYNGEFGFVVAKDKRIVHDVFVKKSDFNGAQAGNMVEVEILIFPSENYNPRGRITKVIADPEAYMVSIDSILDQYEIPMNFPKKVTKEVEVVPKKVKDADVAKKESLEDEIIFTIDGEDARDFDDAVSIKRMEKEGAYEIGVHIADVSTYVQSGSFLDIEARNRGNSFYFPELVIPMLPFKLSNGICSLKPDERRLSLSCFFKITDDGTIKSYRFKDTYIKSCKRFTYNEVFQILEGKDDFGLDGKIIDTLHLMKKAAEALRSRRFKEGSIDFDIPEPKIILEGNKVKEIQRAERNDAHRLIEELMLAANICAAKFLEENEKSLIYRVHERPHQEKINNMLNVVKNLNVIDSLNEEELTGNDFQHILDSFKEHKEEAMVNKLVLRSMQKARYAVGNIGHFGLGFENYCHFTSPIRRYADLIVHRLIKEFIHKEEPAYETGELETISEHISIQERKAVDAERDYLQMRVMEYLDKHRKDEYAGIISGVSPYGVYVELLDYYTDGFVHLSAMKDDYYIYDKEHCRMIGERTAKIYKLGGEVTVDVLNVNLMKKEIELEFLER